MDQLLNELSSSSLSNLSTFSYAEFLLSLTLSFLLSSVLTVVYRITHSGLSYSRSFAMTMVLMSLTISFIMLIIGSNLARAFSLVGALSIIRYRNALKESRDTAFIFLTMAVGMACGTKLYGMAVIFTLFSSAIVFVFEKISFGATNDVTRVVQFSGNKQDVKPEMIEDKIFNDKKWNFELISSETINDESVYTYSVEVKKNKLGASFFNDVSKNLNNCDVKVLTGFEKFNV